MTDEVAELLAELFLHIAPTKTEKVADWAVICLEKGYDSKSLRILASMQENFAPSEFNEYLQRSLKELGWDKFERKDFLMRYAHTIASKILIGRIEPIEAAENIYRIYLDLDYISELNGWVDIDEMISAYNYFLETGSQTYFYRDKVEIETEIKNLAKDMMENKKTFH